MGRDPPLAGPGRAGLSGRADAPMKPAPDAILRDTSHLSIDEALAAALKLIKSKLA